MSILWNPTEATVVEKVSLPVITTGTQNMGDGIYWLKAGTPLDEDYAVANDGDAKYIVAEDFFFVSTNPNQDRHVPLVKAGYVDINKAEASAGITYDDAAVAALETAVSEGTLTEERIRESVLRILRMKLEMARLQEDASGLPD